MARNILLRLGASSTLPARNYLKSSQAEKDDLFSRFNSAIKSICGSFHLLFFRSFFFFFSLKANYVRMRRISSSYVYIPGDVEMLMKEHRENQDLVRSIGASQYQIVFPVQLRHREKMGISTREIGATKVINHSVLYFKRGPFIFLMRSTKFAAMRPQ